MAVDPERLGPIERKALETICRVLELTKFHLRENTANQEDIRVALIEVTDALSAIPSWIAEGTGPGFSSYIESRLASAAEFMERLEVDDFPELPESEDPRFYETLDFEPDGQPQ